MLAIAARDAAIDYPRVAKTGLQRQRFVQHQRTAADGIGGDDVLEHHAFRAGELAAHHGQVIADFGGVEFLFQGFRIFIGEKIGQRAGEIINDFRGIAHVHAIHDAAIIGVGRKRGINVISGVGELFGIVGIDADIDVNAVDLTELFDGVTIFVHELVVARQRGEDVLLQVEARGNDQR